MDALKQTAVSGGNISAAAVPSTSVRMALTALGVFPVMVVYAFLQKYFVKGIAIGAVAKNYAVRSLTFSSGADEFLGILMFF